MIRTAAAAVLAVSLAACSHLPWRAKPVPAQKNANEIVEMAEDGTKTYAFPQYWERNTLVIDMQAAASAGKLILKPLEGRKWPMRLAFRVRPGTFGILEVRADQRMLIPVAREGTKPVDIALTPGVYTPQTEQMTVQWGLND